MGPLGPCAELIGAQRERGEECSDDARVIIVLGTTSTTHLKDQFRMKVFVWDRQPPLPRRASVSLSNSSATSHDRC